MQNLTAPEIDTVDIERNKVVIDRSSIDRPQIATRITNIIRCAGPLSPDAPIHSEDFLTELSGIHAVLPDLSELISVPLSIEDIPRNVTVGDLCDIAVQKIVENFNLINHGGFVRQESRSSLV